MLPLCTTHPVLFHLERLVFPEDALASADKEQLVGCGVLSVIGRRIPCGTTKRSPKHAGRESEVSQFDIRSDGARGAAVDGSAMPRSKPLIKGMP